MPKIYLSRGEFAIVDKADYEWLNQWKWTYHSQGYAHRVTWPDRQCILMHRLIMDTPKGMHTDHANGNRLDNRRKNLRVCNVSENFANRNVKGVYWAKRDKRWQAKIYFYGNHIHLGYFKNRKEAIEIYNNVKAQLHGEFAKKI